MDLILVFWRVSRFGLRALFGGGVSAYAVGLFVLSGGFAGGFCFMRVKFEKVLDVVFVFA